MEDIEHSYFLDDNISAAKEVLRWYEKNDLTYQKALIKFNKHNEKEILRDTNEENIKSIQKQYVELNKNLKLEKDKIEIIEKLENKLNKISEKEKNIFKIQYRFKNLAL